ncbi:MAG: hypothetical protein COB65_08745 [Thalassobium sp.]|nr:MAG: hypothetical protein COB65_08745 [Thalassobium sp.]
MGAPPGMRFPIDHKKMATPGRRWASPFLAQDRSGRRANDPLRYWGDAATSGGGDAAASDVTIRSGRRKTEPSNAPFREEVDQRIFVLRAALGGESAAVLGDAATSGGGDAAASVLVAGQGGGRPNHHD